MARILIQQYLVNNFKRCKILKKKQQQSGGNFDSQVYGWNEIFNRRTLRVSVKIVNKRMK